MKKIVAIVLSLVLVFTLVGCGSSKDASLTESSDETSEFASDAPTPKYESKELASGSESVSLSDSKGDPGDGIRVSLDGEEMMITEESGEAPGPSDVDIAETTTLDKGEGEADILPVEPFEPTVRPRAGQLTAGEWSDNDNFKFFMKVMNENEWYAMQSYWGFTNWDRYAFEITDKTGNGLAGVEVQLYDDAGNEYYTAYTDNNGEVIIYPFINKNFIKTPDVNMRATVNGNSYKFEDLENYNDKNYSFSIDEKYNPVKKVDIMFVIDTTGSMGDEMEYLKEELEYVIEKVKSDNVQTLDINISMNFYKDSGDEYVVKSNEFTSSIDDAVSALTVEYANGGGDFEEAVEKGLYDGVFNHQWREDSQAKLLFLVLDAPPHQTQENIESIHESIIGANEQGIRIIPIASSGIDKETEFLLRFMDMATNGTYIFLTGDSGIGGDHIEPTIGDYDVEYLNDLLIRVINDYIS